VKNDRIAVLLIELRNQYERHLIRLDASDMDPLFRRANMKQMREAIAELERQIAHYEPLHCDIDAAKRYADCHEQ